MIGHETIHYSGFVEEYSLTIIIYGSEDGVLNMGKMEEANRYLPDNSEKYIIEDGNHARFGNYGIQEGDGNAAISSEEQQFRTVALILQNK